MNSYRKDKTMGKIRGTLDYMTNSAGYAADKAGYGVFQAARIVLFLPAKILGFFATNPIITAVIAYVISTLVVMKKLIYKSDPGFFRMLSHALKNPNGFLNGNARPVIILSVVFTIIVLVIIIPLGFLFMKLYEKAIDNAEIANIKARQRTSYRAGFKAEMKYGDVKKRDEMVKEDFLNKINK